MRQIAVVYHYCNVSRFFLTQTLPMTHFDSLIQNRSPSFFKRHQHIQEALTVEFHQQVFLKKFYDMTSKCEYHCRKDSKLKIYAKPLISKAKQKTNNNKCHSIYIRTVSIYPM